MYITKIAIRNLSTDSYIKEEFRKFEKHSLASSVSTNSILEYSKKRRYTTRVKGSMQFEN